MRNHYRRGERVNWNLIKYAVVLLVLFVAVTLTSPSPGYSQNGASAVKRFLVSYLSELGVPQAVGLSLSPREGVFLVTEPESGGKSISAESRLHMVSQFDGAIDSVVASVSIADPINMVFNPDGNRWFLLDSKTGKVIEIGAKANGRPDQVKVKHYTIPGLDIQNAAGVTYDTNNNRLVILDGAGPTLLSMDASGWPTKVGDIVQTDLSGAGLTDLRGVAFDPSTSRLHVYDPVGRLLHELTETGELAQSRDMSEVNIGSLQGLVFAPSADSTDDPSRHNLYLIDNQPATLSESVHLDSIDSIGALAMSEQSLQPGRLVEASITAAQAAAAPDYISSLVQTTDLSQWSPPGPDPSGLAYLESSNTLIICDGEVEETVNNITHFAGTNIWESTLGGNLISAANVSRKAPTMVPMTDEPTGVAWNPTNGHYYFSDDNKKEVYDLDPGLDDTPFTSDDSWTSFDTLTVGSNDPEGITYDSRRDRIFIVDGVNMEVYQFTSGGSQVNQFDVETHGVTNPEGIVFNEYSGTLFILSSSRWYPLIIETTIGGELIQTIDISAASSTAAAGLTLAPASNGSGATHFYIVDRGVDNNDDPELIDGQLYEMSAPPASPPGNAAPTIDVGPDKIITLPDGANLDGTVTDDGLPEPPGKVSSTWSQISGPGTVIFANADAVDTTANFAMPGTYVLRLTANDGELLDIDEVTILVNQPPIAGYDSATTYENRAVNIDVLANDEDEDGDSLTVSQIVNGPKNGAVVKVDKIITYTPIAGFIGVDLFTYEISDGNGGSDTAVVTVTVNRMNNMPEAMDDNAITDENIVVNIDVLANDTDADGDSLTIIRSVTRPSNGSVKVEADDTISFTPDANFYGVDSFTYEISDGYGGKDTATVNITVKGVGRILIPIVMDAFD